MTDRQKKSGFELAELELAQGTVKLANLELWKAVNHFATCVRIRRQLGLNDATTAKALLGQAQSIRAATLAEQAAGME